MKIDAIEITRHRIALDPPVPVSWDSRPRARFAITLVRVRTDEGLEGVAAGDAMDGFADYADLFLGRDPREIERHHAVLDNLCFHYGRYWPFDIALWDLRGKIENRPVFRLLGGIDNRVRAYASTALRRDEAASRDSSSRGASAPSSCGSPPTTGGGTSPASPPCAMKWAPTST